MQPPHSSGGYSSNYPPSIYPPAQFPRYTPSPSHYSQFQQAPEPPMMMEDFSMTSVPDYNGSSSSSSSLGNGNGNGSSLASSLLNLANSASQLAQMDSD